MKSISAKLALDKKFSQFAVDKFELKSGSSAIETSLSDILPGLKLEFKGDDNLKGDFSATYLLPAATLTADVDIVNFSFAKASVATIMGPLTLGGSGHLESKGGQFGLKDFSFGAGYTVPKSLFVGVKVNKKISDYVANFQYTVNKDVSVAGSVNFPKPVVSLGASYKCNPNTALKAKLATDGKMGLSCKQSIDAASTVTGAVTLDINNIGAYKYGLTVSI